VLLLPLQKIKKKFKFFFNRFKKNNLMPASNFSELLVADFNHAFSLFEKNNVVSIKFLDAIMRTLGQHVTKETMIGLSRKVEIDGNIDFDLFLDEMGDTVKKSEPDQIKEAFNLFITDSDGCITSTYLRRVLTKVGEQLTDIEVDDLFFNAKVNIDTKIDFNKFTKIMTLE
jgi:Ca2+-binding EF-hand superfamily protein